MALANTLYTMYMYMCITSTTRYHYTEREEDAKKLQSSLQADYITFMNDKYN